MEYLNPVYIPDARHLIALASRIRVPSFIHRALGGLIDMLTLNSTLRQEGQAMYVAHLYPPSA